MPKPTPTPISHHQRRLNRRQALSMFYSGKSTKEISETFGWTQDYTNRIIKYQAIRDGLLQPKAPRMQQHASNILAKDIIQLLVRQNPKGVLTKDPIKVELNGTFDFLSLAHVLIARAKARR